MKTFTILSTCLFLLIIPFDTQTVSARTFTNTSATIAENEKPDIAQLPAVVKKDGKAFNLLQFKYSNKNGTASIAEVTLSNGIKEKYNLQKGNNSFIIRIPENEKTITAQMNVDGNTTEKTIEIKSFRRWTVYFVQHTHTDIGYPEPQHEILPEYLRYIDYALDFCDQTDNYPDNAKFKWTCETTWVVKEFLHSRPKEQVARLLKRIAEGRIEVAGLYLNMSDMYDESTLSYLMRPLKELKDAKINVRTAIQDDVNGVPWGLVDYMASAGIKYLNMGENGTHARVPFNKPTAFWWESPSGNKVLAYRAEQYHWANTLGILKGDLNGFANTLLPYLNSIEGRSYPFDKTMMQFSGYFIDDAPPSTVVCDLVKQWNEEFEYPKLKLATISEFFNKIEKENAKDIPTFRAAWPDWWTDGVGSCGLETFYVRNTQSDFIASQGLLAMAGLMGAEIKPDVLQTMNSTNDNIAFFDEHTFGAGESISKPLSLNSVVQWNEKSAYAWSAVKDNGLLREKSLGLLRGLLPKMDVPTVTVFNTMNSVRSGVSQFFAYSGITPSDKEVKVIDDKGNEIAVQPVRTGPGGNYWNIYAKDVPAFGYRTYKIVVSDKPFQKPQENSFNAALENDFYKIEIDSVNGGIKSLIDKERNEQLVDSKAPWSLGQFIYERLKKRDLLRGTPEIPYSPDLFTRTSLTNVRFGKVIDRPIWKSVTITGQAQGCADTNGVFCEIRLYKADKKIQLVYSMIKQQVYNPEAVYVAFPFGAKESQISYEVQGKAIVPGKEQLPGSSADWDGVQNFASVRSKGGQIVFVSPEAPLMEFGDINTGKFIEDFKVEKPHVYSYVLNNYWRTNFRAAQEGAMVWTYNITSTSDTSIDYATKFGWGCRVPLVSTVKPANGKDTKLVSNSLLQFEENGLHLVFARPAMDGKGVILCLREVNGRNIKLDHVKLTGKKNSFSIIEVNSLEEPLAKQNGEVVFKPYQTRFLLINNGKMPKAL